MKLEQLTLPHNIEDPEQKRCLGVCIAAMKKAGTYFELRPEPNSRKLFSLWRDKKGWNSIDNRDHTAL